MNSKYFLLVNHTLFFGCIKNSHVPAKWVSPKINRYVKNNTLFKSGKVMFKIKYDKGTQKGKQTSNKS